MWTHHVGHGRVGSGPGGSPERFGHEGLLCKDFPKALMSSPPHPERPSSAPVRPGVDWQGGRLAVSVFCFCAVGGEVWAGSRGGALWGAWISCPASPRMYDVESGAQRASQWLLTVPAALCAHRLESRRSPTTFSSIICNPVREVAPPGLKVTPRLGGRSGVHTQMCWLHCTMGPVFSVAVFWWQRISLDPDSAPDQVITIPYVDAW